ncbi:hypothetical protein PG994_013090 [Apiospora phragmitis]|uniref:Uncharacterized protein n=1 Tax=Apiospora phragmitis TaxID=2905665 RepID=A0ABR1T859_9PEZI
MVKLYRIIFDQRNSLQHAYIFLSCSPGNPNLFRIKTHSAVRTVFRNIRSHRCCDQSDRATSMATGDWFFTISHGHPSAEPSTLQDIANHLPPVANPIVGFQFAGTFLAILASSEKNEQAIVTSTLMLWRSLGMVLGISASSVVFQAFLTRYLNMFVQGTRQAETIALVRGSIEVISGLQEPYRNQVILSFEAALRSLFMGCCVLAAMSSLLLIRIEVPRLTSVPGSS